MAYVVGGLALAVIAMALYLDRLFPRQNGGSPMVRLELARSPAEVQAIIGPQGDPRRAQALESLSADSLFIVSYGALLAMIGVLLWLSGSDWSRVAAVLGWAATLAAVMSDLQENGNLKIVVNQPTPTPASVQRARRWSLCKWICFFLAVGSLSTFFLVRGDLFTLVGGAFAIAAILGIVGLMPGRVGLLEAALTYALGSGLVLLAILCFATRGL